MGIGHLAMGLALKRAEPAMNAGWLVLAAFLCDLLLGVFAILGWERAVTPPDYASRHYLIYDFPYSHGLAACLGWSAGAATAAVWAWRRRSAAVAVAVAVFSHFVLDATVHVRGLPVDGWGSYKIGLGLWNHMGLALALEALITAAGTLLYLRATRSTTRFGRYGMGIFVALLAAVMLGGQATSTSVPGLQAQAMGWIVAPLLFGAAVFWLDGRRSPLGLRP
jgi:hypothetical protein